MDTKPIKTVRLNHETHNRLKVFATLKRFKLMNDAIDYLLDTSEKRRQ